MPPLYWSHCWETLKWTSEYRLARSFVKVAGRNLSQLPLTAFKPTRKASRMSAMNKRSLGSSRAHVLAVLSDCDLQPQARKWPPTQSPKERKQTEECILLPCPLPAKGPCPHRLECSALQCLWGHALSQGTGAGPLSPAPECWVCLDHLSVDGCCAQYSKENCK